MVIYNNMIRTRSRIVVVIYNNIVSDISPDLSTNYILSIIACCFYNVASSHLAVRRSTH